MSSNKLSSSSKSSSVSLIPVAAHLRGMRPTSSIDKDILTINEKLETQNSNNNKTHI